MQNHQLRKKQRRRLQKRGATKTRQGVNPYSGKKMTIKGKPEKKVIKVAALKRIKDMI